MTIKMGSSVSGLPADVQEALTARLEEAPVTLALLFGSHATGQATSGSDLDIALEYDDGLTDLAAVHLTLVADLTRILGRDDIDVVRLTAVDPRIATEAIDHGQRLVGTADEASRLRNQLEPARRERERVVRRRIEDAERTIERRLQRREHG